VGHVCSFAQHGRSVRGDCASCCKAAKRQRRRSSSRGSTSAYTRRGDRQPAASQGLSDASRADRLAAARLGPPRRSPAPSPAASSRRSAARPSRSPAAGCRGQVACRAAALARAGTSRTAVSHGGRSCVAGALRTGRWGFAHGQLICRTAGSYDAPARLSQAGSQHTGLPEARHAGRPARRSRQAAGAGPQCARTAAQAASAALCLSGPGARRPRSAEQLRRRQARVRQPRPRKAWHACPRRGPRRAQCRRRGRGRQQARGPKPYRVGARPPRGRHAQLLQRGQVARAQRGGRRRRRPQAARRALRGAHGDARHAPPEVACVGRARAEGGAHGVAVLW